MADIKVESKVKSMFTQILYCWLSWLPCQAAKLLNETTVSPIQNEKEKIYIYMYIVSLSVAL